MPFRAGVVRRPVLVALFCSFLLLSCTLLYRPATIRILSDMPSAGTHVTRHVRAASRSSGGPTVILMVLALTRALLEYARLALLLLCDEKAVEICYQKRCSPTEVMAEVDQAKDGWSQSEMSSEEVRFVGPREAEQPLQSDHISTNMPVTSSQYPCRLQTNASPNSRCGDCDHRSICGCKEEDFVVELEDDVRKPCADVANCEIRGPEARIYDRYEERTTEAAQKRPASAPVLTEGEAEHRLKEVLLPAMEASSVDVF